MIITAITPSVRKPGRFELEVDGREYARLSIEAIERLKLSVGLALDDRTAAGVQREASILHTYDRALDMLASRGRSSSELRRQLERKGEPKANVAIAIERLTAAGFLDDAAFARHFTRSKAVGGGQSRRRLQQELAKRGVARDVSESAIDEVFEEEQIDDSTSIERVAAKKLRSLGKLEPAVQRRRLYAFLARRGYDVDDIQATIRRLLSFRATDGSSE